MAVAGGDSLKVRDGKGGGVSLHRQPLRRGGNEPPLQRRLQGGHLLPLQPDKPGANQIRFMGALRRQQRTHVPRRSAGGTVPLHAVHRVHDGQAGLEILIQIHNHPGKIPRIRVAEMALRLHGAGNRAKHIFSAAGHGHHAVGFKLAEIDNRVRIAQPCGVFELAAYLSLRETGLPFPKVLIKPPTRLLRRPHAGSGVHPVHVGGIIKPPGTVSHHHIRSPCRQKLHQGTQKPRVGGSRLFRLGKGHQVHLNGNPHSRAHPIQPAQRPQHPLQRRPGLLLRIVGTGDNHNFRLHNSSPLPKKAAAAAAAFLYSEWEFTPPRGPLRNPHPPPWGQTPTGRGWTGIPFCAPRRWP